MFNVDTYYGVVLIGTAIFIVFISYLIWGLKAARVSKVDSRRQLWEEEFWANGVAAEEISEELTAVIAENREKQQAQKANVALEKSNKELADEIAQNLQNATGDLEETQIITGFEAKFEAKFENNLENKAVDASDILETTAKFRTFVAGEEVTPAESQIPIDYSQSFERIKASLDAQVEAIEKGVNGIHGSVNTVNINDLEETTVISRDDIKLSDDVTNEVPTQENAVVEIAAAEAVAGEVVVPESAPAEVQVPETATEEPTLAEPATVENEVVENDAAVKPVANISATNIPTSNIIEEIAPLSVDDVDDMKFFDENFLSEAQGTTSNVGAVADSQLATEAESVVEPEAEPVVEPIIEPIIEPTIEPIIEPVAEPAMEEFDNGKTSDLEDVNGRIRTDLTVEEALTQSFANANSTEQDLESTMIIPAKPIVTGGLADLAVAAVAAKASVSQNISPMDLEDTLHIKKIADVKDSEPAQLTLADLSVPAAVAIPVAAATAKQSTEMLPEKPIAFGSKMAWLAVPGFSPSEVISALKMTNVEPSNWSKGLQTAYEGKNQVFVSPLLRGWTLIIGKVLWNKADLETSVENITWFREVGRAFGNACFYSTMDSLGNHAWVGMRDGAIVRAYGYSGELSELVWQLGEPTDEELALNPNFAAEKFHQHKGDNFIVPNEKMVMQMADMWSIGTTFSDAVYPADLGYIATMK